MPGSSIGIIPLAGISISIWIGTTYWTFIVATSPVSASFVGTTSVLWTLSLACRRIIISVTRCTLRLLAKLGFNFVLFSRLFPRLSEMCRSHCSCGYVLTFRSLPALVNCYVDKTIIILWDSFYHITRLPKVIQTSHAHSVSIISYQPCSQTLDVLFCLKMM